MSGAAADDFDRAMADAGLADLVRPHVDLGPSTTYRVGGPAARMVVATEEAHLRAVTAAVVASGIEVLVVGKGSNLLVADAGFDGLALQLAGEFTDIRITPTGGDLGAVVRAGGAALLPVVARRTVAAGLTGFEWAVGVPGSIGGAVRMNAGGHGSDMAACLERVRVVDLRLGEDGVVSTPTLELGYRSSAVAPHHVVVWAELELPEGDTAASEAELSEIVRWRRDHQPGGQNAGSVFTNPPGDSAGRLIEQAGCKGLRIGTAEVSTKHANFIQADAGGSADDVKRVMDEVRRRVRTVTGVDLHPETRLVGFAPEAAR